ncbi:aldehyde dehydrogenase family protein [Achromobacter sp. UMC46]|uniref:aldehyde dehydrogenase family protein n=1 Tax=Achromobacter sp. UMC46 TaxID=1862319 RepID=UPI0015FEEE3C|nr:aldehyde dehydrogenase family protein [Achromobacter sp. UMC46]MBB1592943.1 hypothetical protein [Achromobacter sp. UMC46]
MPRNGNFLVDAQAPAIAGLATNAEKESLFALGGAAEVACVAQLTDNVFNSCDNTLREKRAALLERFADGIDAIASELAQRISLESGLPVEQRKLEASKAVLQFRQFATVVRQGRFNYAAIESAHSKRPPRPR